MKIDFYERQIKELSEIIRDKKKKIKNKKIEMYYDESIGQRHSETSRISWKSDYLEFINFFLKWNVV